jgi:hypothetical protein
VFEAAQVSRMLDGGGRAMTALNPFATAAIVALCAVGSPHMAQAAEPETLTLACQGTVTNNIKPDAKPEQITMGIVVNFTARTVAGFTYPGLEEFPVVIRAASEVLITFAGSNESGSSIVAGDINRVTGELWASSMMRDANTSNIVTSTTYSLKCRSTQECCEQK